MQDPSILIVTSTYKRPLLLLRAGNSILNQEFKNWAWHIIDDASKDSETERVIELLKSKSSRISSSTNLINKGSGDSKRPHMMGASTNYLASLDDDDWWEPSFLRTLHYVGEQIPETPLIYSDCWAVTKKGYRYWDCSKGKPFPNILPSCVIVRTKDYIRVGGWNEKLKEYHAEANLYLDLGGLKALHHVRLPLTYWTDSPKAMSKNSLKSGKGLLTLISLHPEFSKKEKSLYLTRAALHYIEGGSIEEGKILLKAALKLNLLTPEALVGYIEPRLVPFLGKIYRRYLGMSNRIHKEVPNQWWK